MLSCECKLIIKKSEEFIMKKRPFNRFTRLIPLIACMMTACGDSSSDDASAGRNASIEGPDGSVMSTTSPTACSESAEPPLGCQCATEENFTTYTFEHRGDQRCLTVYSNPEAGAIPLPLIIQPDCYTANEFAGSRDAEAARIYGFHYMDLTTPDGGWDFPNNNEINETNFGTQCDDAASKDVGYLKSVFTVVDQMIADGHVDADKVFVQGFSQNSMFSIFMATCFPNRIAGIWQGGSGLYSQADGSRPLPKCEGACTSDSFDEHEQACIDVQPCETCKFFPVFPEKTGQAIRSCIMMYEDDRSAHSTAVPGYKILKDQGHEPQLSIFGADRENRIGGHSAPANQWAWITHCLGLNDSCTDSCSTQIVACMDAFKVNFRDPDGNTFTLSDPRHRDIASRHYGRCLADNTEQCVRGCAATREMLTIFETPICECDATTEVCDCETSDIPGECESAD